jgi:fluoride exporter
MGALLENPQAIADLAAEGTANEEQALEAQPTGAQEGVAATGGGGTKCMTRDGKRRGSNERRSDPLDGYRDSECVKRKVPESRAALLGEEFSAGARRRHPGTTIVPIFGRRAGVVIALRMTRRRVCAVLRRHAHGTRGQYMARAEQGGPQNREEEETSHCTANAIMRRLQPETDHFLSKENDMPWMNLAAVGVGAAFGAWARWGLSLLLNPIFPSLPMGTLAANLIGGLVIGVVMGVAEPLAISATMRLLIVTGFLGGLTTFSSFSAEAVGTFMRGESGWAIVLVLSHLMGSLLLTGVGVWVGRAVVTAAP